MFFTLITLIFNGERAATLSPLRRLLLSLLSLTLGKCYCLLELYASVVSLCLCPACQQPLI